MRWAVLVVGVVAACGGTDAVYERDRGDPSDLCARIPAWCETAAEPAPSVTERVVVVPSGAMPTGVVSKIAHNNLDAVWFENRLFLAFRTAPNHFASPDTALYVVSTADDRTWVLETRVALGTDLREPRFLAHDGRLYLYMAVLGRDPLAFEPQHALVTEYTAPATWSEPAPILEPGFIPWRARDVAGTAYLIGYTGGENIVAGGGRVDVHWLTTADGRTFAPAVPGKPIILSGGASETDFAFLPGGDLVAVSRNEAGDELGWGSKIRRAPAADLGAWRCVGDPRKYDSPHLFRHGDDVYLIGRRNVTDDGHFDLGRRDLDDAAQSTMYELAYWQEPKRCAVWKVDPDALSVSHVLDLPSGGDTCFAAVLPLGGGKYLVHDYSSPLDDPERTWIEGQGGPTHVYRVTLALP